MNMPVAEQFFTFQIKAILLHKTIQLLVKSYHFKPCYPYKTIYWGWPRCYKANHKQTAVHKQKSIRAVLLRVSPSCHCTANAVPAYKTPMLLAPTIAKQYRILY